MELPGERQAMNAAFDELWSVVVDVAESRGVPPPEMEGMRSSAHAQFEAGWEHALTWAVEREYLPVGGVNVMGWFVALLRDTLEQHAKAVNDVGTAGET